MTDNLYIKIATAVLTEAAMIDHRMRKNTATQALLERQIAAWARVFQREGTVWPHEAMDAVHEHYGKPDAYPLMPGDVIAFCKKQPVASSPEHVSWFLDRWAQHPWSTAIEDTIGREIPELSPDSYDVDEGSRLIEIRRRFIEENRNALVGEIIQNQNRRALTR